MTGHTKNVYCICCDGHKFDNCPLCDDERFFVYQYDDEIEDYMKDFYSESILDSQWLKKNEAEKSIYLDKQLIEYFSCVSE